jgi:hypothetical protein
MALPPKYPLLTLMQLEAKHVAELNKILTMSVNRLDKDIKALGKAGANPITIMQARATKASLESFIGQTFDNMEQVIALGMKEAAAAASGVVSAYEAQLLGMVMSPEAVANLAKSEAQRAAQGIEAALKRVQGSSYVPLSTAVYNTKQMTLGWVEKRITQGLASGWSAAKLAGELKDMINPNVKGGVSYAAMRTARTEINNSFHASSAERYLNSPIVTEVDWNLSSSHPEGDECDTFADESPYPKQSVPRKPHPQCYCFITPALPEPAKFIDNLFKGKYGSPPTAAETAKVATKAAGQAGTSATKQAAQNAIHNAIKHDPAPTKKSLVNQLNINPDYESFIADPQALQKIVNAMDDTDKKWFQGLSAQAKKDVLSTTDDFVEDSIYYIKQTSGSASDEIFDLDALFNKLDDVVEPPVWTNHSIAEHYGLDPKVTNSLSDISKLTPDQMDAQLKKFTSEQLADIKSMDVYDQGYYIKTGTTPTKDSYLKPTTPTKAPDMHSLAAELDIPEQWLWDSGATPHQIVYFFKGLDGKSATINAFKTLPNESKELFLQSAKTMDMGKIKDYSGWLQKNGFLNKADDIVPKTTFLDLEDITGIPSYVLESVDETADDIMATIKMMEADPKKYDFWEDALEDADAEKIVDILKYQHKLTKKPIIDPDTIPAPKVPDLPPKPVSVNDTYQNLVDQYPEVNWKPELLKKTGATPQQISDYMEANYDHLSELKWPSQKKHFEKLATKTDNASTYEAKVAFQNAETALPAPKPPLTSDGEILAKWQGKVQPPKPIEPKPPTGDDADLKEFIKLSKAKFKAFADSTGNAKNDLTKSNNWNKFVSFQDNGTLSLLDELKAEKYIDDDLYQLAKRGYDKKVNPNPADAAKFKSAMADYGKAREQFEKELVEWRAANGITSTAKGVWEGALVHNSDAAGVAWANKNLSLASGEKRAAIKKYSGSSYGQWNAALRANASGDSLPGGEWASWTSKADKGMAPIPEDVVVRRGTGWNEFVIGGDRKGMIPPPPPSELIGSIQTQHGYTSTSVGSSSAFGGQVNMRIRVPQGHPAAWVDPYSSHQGERELLLSRSTNYYIHDVYQENNRWYIDAEVIPVGEDASTWTPVASPNRPK